MSQTIITATHLAKQFAGSTNRVVDDISLSIDAGQAIAVVGSNGAGKSTLLRCLVGLIPLSAGEVRIFDESFTKSPSVRQRRNLRRNIGFVFQFHGLVGRLSTLSNVVHGALGQGTGWRAWHQMLAPAQLREDAMAALDRVGLAERAHDRAEQLSGGQSQRVAIARAIMHQPKLVIADEPAASLDPSAGHDVMSLFRELANGDVSLIYTTHNVEHALAFSDRVIAMRAGKCVIDRPTADVSAADLEAIYRD